MSPLEILLEIVKLTIPGLVVFATVYVLMNQLTEQLLGNRRADQKIESQKITLNLRLQAYERLSLYCERISVPNLIMRLRTDSMTVASLKWAMFQAIQQEFEYNITQQIYISESLWKILQLSKDNVMSIIDRVAADLPTGATADDFVHALFTSMDQQEYNPLQTALSAIKKEAALSL
ncbi:MAG: hypothetical protein KA479_08920 [Saprospiraceae bacterium]|jgi:hypothetical protein|nr:hypothetical protein [Saprospiraceae bacterium]